MSWFKRKQKDDDYYRDLYKRWEAVKDQPGAMLTMDSHDDLIEAFRRFHESKCEVCSAQLFRLHYEYLAPVICNPCMEKGQVWAARQAKALADARIDRP